MRIIGVEKVRLCTVKFNICNKTRILKTKIFKMIAKFKGPAHKCVLHS